MRVSLCNSLAIQLPYSKLKRRPFSNSNASSFNVVLTDKCYDDNVWHLYLKNVFLLLRKHTYFWDGLCLIVWREKKKRIDDNNINPKFNNLQHQGNHEEFSLHFTRYHFFAKPSVALVFIEYKPNTNIKIKTSAVYTILRKLVLHLFNVRIFWIITM